MKKVEIIVSTFNGEKYIEQQIESLFSQTYENIKIIVRDDGSTDNTLKILEKYEKSEKSEKIEIHKCSNVGVVESFFQLLKLTSEDVDYIAFCDQDDIWKTEKIERAINVLKTETEKTPLLYCSSVVLVDEKLKEIKLSNIPNKPLSLKNSVVENVATGCTCVINREMKSRVIGVNTTNILMHDWWLYLVASTFGKVIFDEQPTMYYRQHSNNVIGSGTTFFAKWQSRIKNFKKNHGQKKLRLQAKKFSDSYIDLSKEQKEMILNFVNRKNLKDNITFLFENQLYRQKLEDNIIFKILILLNFI